MEFEVTKMGERGQIVIPQEFRKEMNLHRGEKFMIIKHDGNLLLKRMEAPTIEEFNAMIKKGHARAKKLGLTPEDTESARKRARAKK